MEASFKTQIQVGVFALLGLIVLVVSILALGGNQLLFRSTYTLQVHFDQVQGLSRGSVVSLMGFPVGNVDKIDFLPNGLLEVSLEVDENFQNQITVGSQASVKTQGALGDRYVYITPGEKGSQPLQAGQILQAGETTDFIDQIASESEKLSGVGDVIEQLNVLLKNLNHENNSQKLIKNLTKGSQSVDQFFATAEGQTLVRLNSILKKIDEGDGTLGELINDKRIYKKIMGFLGD
ncbi:MAG: MCE family protein, partial [Bdellovibrionales bacterium]|nr:MCE family protein [Bdellovibrionales bacterium]